MRAQLRLVALLFLTSTCAFCAEPAGKPLELAQIFGPDAVALERRPATRWIARGAAYTTLEPVKDGEGVNVARYDTATGKRTILITSVALTPAGAKALVPTDHEWSADGRRLLLSVGASGARRNNPICDAWVFDTKSSTLTRVGSGLPAGSLLYPEFSPDGARAAFVSGNDLYVDGLDGSAPLRLTTDGGELILNGRGDIAHEEEFSLGKAFLWSPDSKRLAYWRFDTNGVGIFTIVKNTDGQYPKTTTMRYPKPGTTNSAVQVGVVSADKPGTTWFALSGDPRNNYVPRMDWAGPEEVLLQYENRPQNTNQVLLGDAKSGALKPVMTEKDKAWLLPSEEVHWLKGGREFTWMSERDGWMHLYVISRDGKSATLRTPGNYDVARIESIDEKAGLAWFTASPENVTQRYLYRATLTGAPRVVRITPAGSPGSHDYDLAPGGSWAVHTYSTADSPPVVDIVKLPAHSSTRVLARNEKMRALLAATPHLPTEFFKVDIGGTALDAYLIKPPDFDAAKKYPLLVYVYSEPAGQTVADRWGGDRNLFHLMLAQQGYLVASIDSRGAAAPRGHDWRRSIYGGIGIQASADQAAAIRKMMAERAYIDPARIGVWGWSGGGAMTLNAMFRYPDLYSTGVAVASPVDQKLYNSIYQERYMGLPADNPVGYRDGSPINFAQNLKGNLLIIHGTGDDNVHYQNAEQLVNRLISLNKPFSMMAYPDRTHGIYEGVNTRLHLFGLVTRYLNEHLPPTH